MNDEKNNKFYIYFIFGLISITIVLIFLRIILYFFQIAPWINENKDIDFYILIEGMENGIVHFYDPITLSDWPPYYLYFWYFIFFPVYLLPVEIGLYVWDFLRLITVGYVFYRAKVLFKHSTELLIFYILSSIGFAYDAFFNNANFLVLFFLFNSYFAWEKEKKLISGILFTLATFKINSILFLPLLLILKKAKLKEIYYFIVPFFVMCIPYILFPDYFNQMFNNWMHSDEQIRGIFFFDSITWKALQPSHLMFISLLILVFQENLEAISLEEKRIHLRIVFLLILIIYYTYLTIICFFIPVILT